MRHEKKEGNRRKGDRKKGAKPITEKKPNMLNSPKKKKKT